MMADLINLCLKAQLVFIALCQVTSQKNLYKNVSETIDKLLDGKNYDRRLRPHFDGPTDNVSINMILVSFGKIREVDMDFAADMFLVQYWSDPRLRHTLKVPINLTGEFIKQAWIPDTFFLNIKEAKFHVVPSYNNRVAIEPNGNVLYSARFTLTASCEMDLRKYPLDKQSCQLILLSYSYPTSEVDYNWKNVEVIDDTMTEFELIGISRMKQVYHYSTGDWTQIYVTFNFKRRFGYVFIQAYAPTVLIVMLSWLSFWISKDAVPARIALGITTVLTIVTLMGSFRGAVPRVSYVKALDMYFIISFLFVFGAMLEYVAVMVYGQTKKGKQLAPKNSPQKSFTETTAETEFTTKEDEEREEIKMEQRSSSIKVPNKILKKTRNLLFPKNDANPIDKTFRILSPLLFTFFNIVYWVYYLYS